MALVLFAASAMLATAATLAFAQVFLRFVLHSPSTWAGAVTQLLIVWMVHLGVAVTIRQGALVSLEFLRGRLGTRLRPVLDLIVTLAMLAFFGNLLVFGLEVVERVHTQRHPALGLSIAWGYAAVPTGAAFSIVAPDRAELGAGPGAGDHDRGRRGVSSPLVVLMCLLLALGIPIAISIGLASILTVHFLSSLPPVLIGQQFYVAIDKSALMAIPFFILAGNIMEAGGISQRLIDFAKSLIGDVRGSLALTCVLTCMIFASVSGSGTATTFAIGAIMIPALRSHGYPAPWATSLQATSAEVGVIIPPSIPLILFGVAADVSIGELFVASVIPGIPSWAGTDALRARLDPRLRDSPSKSRRIGYRSYRRCVEPPWHCSCPSLSSEASTAASSRRRKLQSWRCSTRSSSRWSSTARWALRDLGAILNRTVVSSSIIMFIIAAAGLFSFLINRSGAPTALTNWLLASIDGPIAFLIGVNVFLLVVGMFIEGAAAIIVLAPHPDAGSRGARD